MVPDRLYEALPAIYAVVGFWALLAAENTLGVFSSLLLLTAAGVITKLRYDYRRGNA